MIWNNSIEKDHQTPSWYSNTILGITGATSRIRTWDLNVKNPLKILHMIQFSTEHGKVWFISMSPICCLFWLNQALYKCETSKFGITQNFASESVLIILFAPSPNIITQIYIIMCLVHRLVETELLHEFIWKSWVSE